MVIHLRNLDGFPFAVIRNQYLEVHNVVLLSHLDTMERDGKLVLSLHRIQPLRDLGLYGYRHTTFTMRAWWVYVDDFDEVAVKTIITFPIRDAPPRPDVAPPCIMHEDRWHYPRFVFDKDMQQNELTTEEIFATAKELWDVYEDKRGYRFKEYVESEVRLVHSEQKYVIYPNTTIRRPEGMPQPMIRRMSYWVRLDPPLTKWEKRKLRFKEWTSQWSKYMRLVENE